MTPELSSKPMPRSILETAADRLWIPKGLCAIVNSPHEAPYCTMAKPSLFPESPVLNGTERWALALRNDT
jgi:hypothetical protein